MSDTFDQEAVDLYIEDIGIYSRMGWSGEKIRKHFLRRNKQCGPLVDEALTQFRRQMGLSTSKHHVGAYVRERQGKQWYKPNAETDIYWPDLRDSIEQDLGPVVDSVDETSTVVLNGLRPHTEVQHTKGLVLGYVQSGKTTNFLSVIAKAADAGFRLIIVLTGITENLRKQTQQRIDQQLIEPKAQHWHRLTTEEHDFSGDDANAARLANTNDRFIAVVKKNSSRLRKLNAWLNSAADTANNCPILVIDDESDQASIDVSPKDKSERSAINRQINSLLEYDKTAYIAYSATPFANILIDPNKLDDLYPSDFIVTLPEPKGYFGSRALFGSPAVSDAGALDPEADDEALDMIRLVPEDEVEDVRPGGRSNPEKEVVPGNAMVDAIRWFIMATAARRHRGQHDKHSSMLIHTSMLTNDHMELKFHVKHIVADLGNEVKAGELESWRTQWEEETVRVPAEQFGLETLTFNDIEPHIEQVIDATTLVMDNGYSTVRLGYDKDKTETVIAIGGNTLARGLTLEGLVSSYFVRRATAYDTLLQMGRWFGFRNGYQDLPRIWMPTELKNWFHDLSVVEAELRSELDVYMQQQQTPIEIQARIRTHPDMIITSRAKMQSAVDANISFAGKKEQTIKFKEKDAAWLQQNLDATRKLVEEIRGAGCRQKVGAYGSPLFTDVPTSIILDFLAQYEIHPDTRLGDEDASLVKRYITNEANAQRLRKWNVSFITQSSKDARSIDLGLDDKINLVSRAKLVDSPIGAANIKALVGSIDRLNDVERSNDQDRADFRAQVKEKLQEAANREGKIRELHDQHVGAGIGHLAIYAIDKDSKPRNKQPKASESKRIGKPSYRADLDAVQDVIGIGLFFPTSDAEDSQVEYRIAPEPEQETLEHYVDTSEEITTLGDRDEQDLESEANGTSF